MCMGERIIIAIDIVTVIMEVLSHLLCGGFLNYSSSSSLGPTLSSSLSNFEFIM